MPSVPEQLDKLIVVKIGSSTLVDAEGGVDREFVTSLARQFAQLLGEGYHIVFVSSGAVAAGRERLGFTRRPTDMPSLQACAATGQVALMEVYAHELAALGVPCGQVLLTRRDFVDRECYLNARNTLFRLLDLGAIPVVNENDTISVAEFAFGDNDMLGAIVSALVGADLYVILSDVEGLYDANPQEVPTAKLVRHVDHIDSRVAAMAGGAGTSMGTGGMSSKVRAARAMLACGIPTVICEGRADEVIVDVAHGRQIGTRFEAPAGSSRESGRKLWIGLAEVPRGTLVVDDGAKRAIAREGASVLPVGVVSTTGSYAEGDVVNVVDLNGVVLARGVARFSSDDMTRIRGLKSEVIARFMPEKAGQPAVHRDEMLVF
jgi:glutamate 5-kinase